jgi:hypothetical protein
MRLILGMNEHLVCVWEPGALRSIQEARRLLAHGCDASDFEWSQLARPFLELLSPAQRSLIDVQEQQRGRLVFGARSQDERKLLHEVARFAVDLGLSVYRPPNVVQARVVASDQLGFWRALTVLGAEQGAVLEVASSTGLYEIVHAPGTYEIFAEATARSHGSRLQLLGFRHTPRGRGRLARRLLARGMRSVPPLLAILGGEELAEDECFDLRLIARGAGEKLRLVPA